MFTPFEAIGIIFTGILVIAVCMLLGWGFGACIRQGEPGGLAGISTLVIFAWAIGWMSVYEETNMSGMGSLGVVVCFLILFVAFGALGELFTWGCRAMSNRGYRSDYWSDQYGIAAVVGVPILVVGLGVIAYPLLVV